MTQSPCCWKAKWVTLTDLCKSSQDELGQLPWPGQEWEWEVLDLGTGEIGPGLTDSSYNTWELAVLITATVLRWENLPACKCMGITLDQKRAEMHQPLHGRALGATPEPNTSVERRGVAPAAPSTVGPPGNACFSGYSQRTTPWTVPVDCRVLPRQAQKAISHSWTIQKQILRLKRTLAVVRQGQARGGKKYLFSWHPIGSMTA